ncbi:MAG: tetratricopeptide repeat protein [Acidobacteriota bacterium]
MIRYRDLLIIVALCVVAYANSLGGAFIWDDEIQVIHNTRIRSLANIPEAFTKSVFDFATDRQYVTNFYRPVQMVVYAVAYSMGQLSPTPYHALSLLFHILASLLVYLILVQLAIPASGALLAAALFAVHPIHTEAVSWIAAVPEVTCGAFYFAALWAFLKSISPKNQSARIAWMVAGGTFYLAALLSKEMAITLPVVLLLFAPRTQRKALLAPVAGVTAVYLALRFHVLGFLLASASTTNVRADWVDWTTLAMHAFGDYIRLVLIPFPLTAYHLLPVRLEDRLWPTLFGLIGVLAVGALAWVFRKRFREGLPWLASFVVMLAPVFYLKGISAAFVSERYLYIPSLAVVALGGAWIVRSGSKHAMWAGWLLVALFTGLTIQRNQAWQDGETLYRQALANNPEILQFQLNESAIQKARGDEAGARASMEVAARVMASGKYSQIDTDRFRLEIALGASEAAARNFPQATVHFMTAQQLDPSSEWSYLYLGGIAIETEPDSSHALEYLNTAIRLGPSNEMARYYQGVALFNAGRKAEAVAAFREALRINPDYRDARVQLTAIEQTPKP